jgi:hypothetical protein
MKRIIDKLDNLFEQFDVPREPVKSGMMQAVATGLRGVWDLNSNFKRYDRVNPQVLKSKIHNFNELARKIKVLEVQIERSQNTDWKKNKDTGVSEQAAAVINKFEDNSKITDISIIKKYYKQLAGAVAQIAISNKSNEGMAEDLIRVLKKMAPSLHMQEEELCGLIDFINDNKGTGFYTIMEEIANQTADKTAAEVA